jgi:hypothetical protein
MHMSDKATIRWTRQADGSYTKGGALPADIPTARIYVIDDDYETNPHAVCPGLKLWLKEEAVELVERKIAEGSYREWRYELRPEVSNGAALSHEVDALGLFSDRLAKAGYNPADAGRYLRPLRVLAEELYRVDESFPKLTKKSFGSGLPPGIGDVTYSLSMAACLPWRVATVPTDAEVALFQK